MRSPSAIFMSHNEAITRKSSPYAVVKKEWEIEGLQR